MRFKTLLAAGAIACVAAAVPARADEGMWTFDAFPAARMKADYGWAPDQAWLDRTRAAAVRLTGGCSASFVSGEGLILTNHHCVASCLSNLSTAQNDLLANGFNPASRAEERTCPGQQAEVVTSIRDVTGDVKGAIAGLSGADLVKARDARIAEIEKAGCTDPVTTRCQVVTLFGGGQYKLYSYRKYSDVRIAWAPEAQMAFFGGDPDNFNFPRYAMDGAFLRAYENGKPVMTPQHLMWSPRAPQDGEATFVVGNPGTTRRLDTEAQRAFRREIGLPLSLILMSEYRGRLIAAMGEDKDRLREGEDELSGVENSFKAQLGQFRSLNDAQFTAAMRETEMALKGKAAPGVDPWGNIAAADAAYRQFYLEDSFVKGGPAGYSDLFGYARVLVRGAAERAKPNAERLPGFTDSALPLTEKRLIDPRPVYPWLEELGIAFWGSKMREYLGADNGDVKMLLGKESPENLARRLVAGSTLADPAVRKALWEGGADAIAKSDDPMIKLALAMDARSREIQKRYDAEVDGPITAAKAQIADARFAAYGDANYPDATFTLRISYGKVQGWTERGNAVPFATYMGGTFDRATGDFPFNLSPGFAAASSRIDPAIIYNFVTTNDIIGGNSGSPVLDKDGHVIGAAFDGNIHSLGGAFGYDDTLNRTVVVSAASLQHALEVIYPNAGIVKELKGAKPKKGKKRK